MSSFHSDKCRDKKPVFDITNTDLDGLVTVETTDNKIKLPLGQSVTIPFPSSLKFDVQELGVKTEKFIEDIGNYADCNLQNFDYSGIRDRAMKTMEDYDYTPIVEQVIESASKALDSIEPGKEIKSVLQKGKETVEHVRDTSISVSKWTTSIVLFIVGVLVLILLCVMMPLTITKIVFLGLGTLIVGGLLKYVGFIVETKLTALYCKGMKNVDTETCKGESPDEDWWMSYGDCTWLESMFSPCHLKFASTKKNT